MNTDTATLRLHGPEDIISAIPYLLGFHPEQSLILVGLADRRVIVTARIDLDDATVTVVDSTTTAIARGGARELIAIIDENGPSRWRELASLYADILTAAATASLNVRDCLHVRAGTWRSLECVDLQCCPLAGRPLPSSPSAVDAAAAVAGLHAQPDRESVISELDPIAGGDLLLPTIRAAEAAAAKADLQDEADRQRQLAIQALTAAHARAASTAGSPMMPMPRGSELPCAMSSSATRSGSQSTTNLTTRCGATSPDACHRPTTASRCCSTPGPRGATVAPCSRASPSSASWMPSPTTASQP